MIEIKPVGGIYEIRCSCGKKLKINVRHDKQTVELID